MRRRVPLLLVLACLLIAGIAAGLLSCGGGGSSNLPAPVDESLITTPAADATIERNRLVTSMPALGRLASGTEFDYVISAELTEELYQCSLRVEYDPAVVEPVDSTFGDAVPAGMVRMARLSSDGLVPCALTALPGGTGIAAGTGELIRIRFRLRGTPDGRAVRLVNDAGFLQLRDRSGQRLSFDLATEEVR
ncbi:hypothetical protein JW859_05060 [bacterium]|nr:hypothetical protein [bacterium]